MESALDDLAVRLRQPVLPELPDHVDRDVVAEGDVAVEKYAVQDGFAGEVDPSFLHQFAPQRFEKALADLDPAARQMPAGNVTVADQKYLVLGIEHDAANAQGHAAGETPIEVEQVPQLRLEALSQVLESGHGYPGWTDVMFDPYIAA